MHFETVTRRKMNYFLRQALEDYKIKYGDPNDPVSFVKYKNPRAHVRTSFGIVVDNKDPINRGRLKVHFPLWGDNIISNWIPLVRPFSGAGSGTWMIPDIGQQVICVHIGDKPDCPVVMGTIYTPREMPPVNSTPDNYIKTFTTKSGSHITMDDHDDGGSVTISVAEGKIRLILDKNGGIKIINEYPEGKVNFKCRKFNVTADDAASITAIKKVSMKADDNLEFEAQKINVKSAGKIACQGTQINLEANGVCAENKQIAAENDQAIGIDFHKEWVQAGSSRVQVPIPNPFMGKLTDALSTDVNFKGKPVATKDSIATTEPHKVMPPGDSFVQPPKNEGKVTNGCIPSVKVNGKEVAVLGSTVTSCDDNGAMDQSKIIAMGASAVVPIQIPVTNPIDREITQARFMKTEAKVGEEIMLEAQLRNQFENLGVQFKIFPEGANVETDKPVQILMGRHNGGSAVVKWNPTWPAVEEGQEEPEEVNYIFTASSFGCETVQGDVLTVSPIVPEFSELKWWIIDPEDENKENWIESSEVEYGKKVKVSADVTNLENGDKVKVFAYNSDYQNEKDYIVKGITEVNEGKIEFEWDQAITNKDLSELQQTDILELLFIVEANNVKSQNSSNLKLVFTLEIRILHEESDLDDNDDEKYILESTDGTYYSEKSISNDKIKDNNSILIKFLDVLPGLEYNLKVVDDDSEDRMEFEEAPFSELIYINNK